MTSINHYFKNIYAASLFAFELFTNTRARDIKKLYLSYCHPRKVLVQKFIKHFRIKKIPQNCVKLVIKVESRKQ